jgi:hypothetical protein
MSDADTLLIVGFIIAILNIIFVTPVLFGVVFYEKFGSDKKRSLINQLVASICWMIIIWNCTVQPVTVARFLFGPFSGTL